MHHSPKRHRHTRRAADHRHTCGRIESLTPASPLRQIVICGSTSLSDPPPDDILTGRALAGAKAHLAPHDDDAAVGEDLPVAVAVFTKKAAVRLRSQAPQHLLTHRVRRCIEAGAVLDPLHPGTERCAAVAGADVKDHAKAVGFGLPEASRRFYPFAFLRQAGAREDRAQECQEYPFERHRRHPVREAHSAIRLRKGARAIKAPSACAYFTRDHFPPLRQIPSTHPFTSRVLPDRTNSPL